jgi:glycosyltransferase involved in cell wall biosynthesis
MIKLLINATPCAVGGAVQVALGFIREAMTQAKKRNWELFLAVSPAVGTALEDEISGTGVRMEIFRVGPGSLIAGRATRARLKALCREWKADMVFTVFGPSYVRFPVPEFMGFADGFAIIPMKGCYANHAWKSLPVAWLKANAKRFFLRSAKAFWVETETARAGLCRRAWISPDRVSVVSNGVNGLFAWALLEGAPADTGDMLVMGAGYPHKNHRLLPAVARLLEERLSQHPWRFVVTLPDDAPAWLQLRADLERSGLSKRVINRGVLTLVQCAEAYEEATLVFHPSLLEIFSAGYVEAMAARRPLLVSDRSFSREICADAAGYFEPTDPVSAADCLEKVLTDEALRHRLVAAGTERLKSFPDASAKNGKLCDLIDAFAKEHCHR